MMKKLLVLCLAGLTAVSATAEENTVATKAIESSLKQALPGVTPDTIKPTPIAGLYEVVVGPKLFYVSADGNYLIQGAMIDVKAKTDLTEPRLALARVAALSKVGDRKVISFKPKAAKHHVYVFTDIDCGYCRKLHSEIDQYLQGRYRNPLPVLPPCRRGLRLLEQGRFGLVRQGSQRRPDQGQERRDCGNQAVRQSRVANTMLWAMPLARKARR